MINMFQIKTTKGENMTQCKKVTETSTNEKEYEDFLQQLEAKNIIKKSIIIMVIGFYFLC